MLQPIISYLIESHASNANIKADTMYQMADYQYGFTPILVIVILGILAANSVTRDISKEEERARHGKR